MQLSFKEYELQGWENVATAYHNHFGKFTSEIASILVDRATIKPKDRLLDVACGPGYVGSYALEKEAQVVAISFRVLKSGGKFLFTMWDKPIPFDMLLETVKEEVEITISLPEGPDFFKFREPNTSKKNPSRRRF
jgi:hypothetical protein